MPPFKLPGVISHNKRLFTKNLAPGITVYNEKLLSQKGEEYRSWNPYRSKLAAALMNGLDTLEVMKDSKVLYLGAATGTTVSHVSDMVHEGMVYAIELSPLAAHSLCTVCKQRPNIIPIIADANHPDRYSAFIPPVDVLYQDISQRNQAAIFLKNIERYLKKEGQGLLMVKARSIDVALSPKKAYAQVATMLQDHGLSIHHIIDLSPYEKDHAAISITNRSR